VDPLGEEQAAMTPTLIGRIQTRWFLVLLIGVPWTFLIGPLLAGMMDDPDASTSDVYRLAFGALVLVAVVGVVWELIYHGLQQYRWEKDWPTLFGLIQGVPEGVLIAVLLDAGLPWDVGSVPLGAYTIHFGTSWVLIWLFANGPMRVLFVRWRFRGGRLL
jgi:hypothetical protein